MTDLERIKLRIPDEENEAILKDLLETSKDVVLTRLYPYEDEIDELSVPKKYKSIQIEIAVEIWAKRGAEGEKSHNENGVSRTYENSFVSESLLSQIIPCAKVIGRSNENDA